MRISPVNNTSFGRVRIRRTPINYSYLKAVGNKNNEVLDALNDSLSSISAKTGDKLVIFSVDLKNKDNNQQWVLTVSDPMNANELAETAIDRKADTEEYIKQIKLLAANTPKLNTVSSINELISRYG